MTTFYVLPNCVGNPLLGTCAVLHLCCVPFLWLLTEFAALHILFFATNNQRFHKPTWSFVTVASVFHIFRNCVVQLTRLLLCSNYSCYYSCGRGIRTPSQGYEPCELPLLYLRDIIKCFTDYT